MTVRLAVDGMGGDKAPSSVFDGIKRALKANSDVHYSVYGDAGLLAPLLQKYKLSSSHVTIIHTAEAIPSDMRPAQALRQSKNTSMRLAIEAVAQGEADAVISSGNTGAYMALAKNILKTLPGIERPAICGMVPTEKGQCVMLDMGANLECSPEMLLQFALMGSVFAQHGQMIENPLVGLLNIGEETQKGHQSLQDAYRLFRDNADTIHFKGFIEGNDIFEGKVDVVVSDGFSGNIAIKAAEGTTRLFSRFMREAIAQSFWANLGSVFLLPLVKQIRKRLDPRLYNGAMFIGLNHVAIKSHGGSDGLGFFHAIMRTIEIHEGGVNHFIQTGVKKLSLTRGQHPKTMP